MNHRWIKLRGAGRIIGAPRHLRRASTRGFSLLEVLVAFVILATVVTALFGLFSSALRNAGAADEYNRAVLIAQSRLAMLATEPKLQAGTSNGSESDSRFEWQVSLSPYTPAIADPQFDASMMVLPIQLWRAVVTVRWPGPMGGDRSIAMSTLRLSRKD